ncbi:MAG: protease modulator HflC [Gammaproteobacteria bacterium]|jgi:membrane protease subunit HflC|nr:protease modulator HflC [Gammaproteobacteria bacterium]MBQ0775048.1 protease modulator HflC [Gammaproteobacteria bacterium]|tara:strand:- start:137982 stop:138875 length:894 start_codon:yes stop_codon:yes gene_type:complete
MGNRGLVVAALFAVALLVSLDAFYFVNETEKAVLKQFGRIVRTDIEPGMHPKIPLFQNVVRADARVMIYSVPSQGFQTSEKKFMNVNYFIVWRIADIQRYLTTFGGGSQNPRLVRTDAEGRFSSLVANKLRDEFGQRTVQEAISGERVMVMDDVARDVNAITLQEFGVEIVDIRVKQLDWQKDVRESVFARMRAERNRDASEHRARGQEAAERIRAEADRTRTVLLAEAYRDAQTLRGEGDAEAAGIYAKAYNRDPEFYRFYRSLQAYRETLNDSGDLMVLEPDSDFFRYLKKSTGK